MFWFLPASLPSHHIASLSLSALSTVFLDSDTQHALSSLLVCAALPQLLKLVDFMLSQLKFSWSSRLHQVPPHPFHRTIQLPWIIYMWVCNIVFIFEKMSVILIVLMSSCRMKMNLFFAYQIKPFPLSVLCIYNPQVCNSEGTNKNEIKINIE